MPPRPFTPDYKVICRECGKESRLDEWVDGVTCPKPDCWPGMSDYSHEYKLWIRRWEIYVEQQARRHPEIDILRLWCEFSYRNSEPSAEDFRLPPWRSRGYLTRAKRI